MQKMLSIFICCLVGLLSVQGDHLDPFYVTDYQCDSFKDVAQPRIIGGNVVNPPGKYPHMVSIFQRWIPNGYQRWIYNDFQRWCGGSVITMNYVVTAAHCVSEFHSSYLGFPYYYTTFQGRYQKHYVKKPSNLVVVAGDHDLCSTDMSMECSSDVEKILIHPDYIHSASLLAGEYVWNISSDIAVLKVSKNLLCNSLVKAACLPKFPPTSNLPVVTIGWGLTNLNKSLSNIKEQALLKEIGKETMTNESCLLEVQTFNSKLMICVGPKHINHVFKGGFKGDSGGPLLYRQKGQTDVLIGIRSYGIKPFDYVNGKEVSSGVSFFTAVYPFIPWITEITNVKDNC